MANSLEIICVYGFFSLPKYPSRDEIFFGQNLPQTPKSSTLHVVLEPLKQAL